jgi:hypothetical protein
MKDIQTQLSNPIEIPHEENLNIVETLDSIYRELNKLESKRISFLHNFGKKKDHKRFNWNSREI